MLAIFLVLLLVAGLILLVIYSFPRLVLRLVLSLAAVVLVLGAAYLALGWNFDRQLTRVDLAFVAPSADCESGLELLISNGSGRDLLYLEGDIQGFEPGHSRPKIVTGAYNELRLESDLIVPAGDEARLCRQSLPWTLIKDSIMSRQERVDPAAYRWELANQGLCLSRSGLERRLSLGSDLAGLVDAGCSR